MGRPSKHQIMELYTPEIIGVFNETKKIVFNEEELRYILFEHKNEWKLPKSTTISDFLLFLTKKDLITYVEITFPYRVYTRYLFNKKLEDINIYKIATSLQKNSYISHYTAAFVHHLTDNIVKNVFVNSEQKPKNTSETQPLSQENIDNAFKKKMRTTSNIGELNNRKIIALNGKYTEQAGITIIEDVPITNLERTLIDVSVRPGYAGGVFEVMNMYKKAKGVASVNKIYSLLKKINYKYPYHQVIGFYLEKNGYKENAVKLMEKFPMEFDFYLAHNMKDTSYSNRWKLFYPKELDD